jgi:hypothetical protein
MGPAKAFFAQKGIEMLRISFVLVLMAISAGAHAEVFMCKKPTGETEFSDTPCKVGSTSEVVPDREHLTKEQQDTARVKLEQQKQQANDQAARRIAAEPPREPEVAPPPPSEEVYGGGGCYDGRGLGSNCAGDPYRRPPLVDRPINRPGPRPSPR